MFKLYRKNVFLNKFVEDIVKREVNFRVFRINIIILFIHRFLLKILYC